MSQPAPDYTASLARIGNLIATNEKQRRKDRERLRAVPEVDKDDSFDAEVARGLAEIRDSQWRRIIPQMFHTAHLDDWHGEVGETLEDWATNPDGRNLILLGPVGTGKTHAAIAACRHPHNRGLAVQHWPTGRLLDALRPSGPGDVEIGDVVGLDRLILDDIGVERPTDWTAERLDLIIDGRWAEERPTVVTTNLTPDVLEERLGARTFSRLVGGAVTLRLTGKDRRRATR